MADKNPQEKDEARDKIKSKPTQSDRDLNAAVAELACKLLSAVEKQRKDSTSTAGKWT